MSAERPTRRPWWRSRWWMPAFSLFLGGVMLLAFSLGGHTADGLKALAVMAALAVLFLLGTRSETLQGLGGPGRDERWAAIDTRATAFAGVVVMTVLIGVWLYELAKGRDASPYGELLAIMGVTYIVAIAWLRWRS